MASKPRREIFDPLDVNVIHVGCRTALQDWTFGKDNNIEGLDLTDRREWIVGNFESAASLFAIDIGFASVMANHFHGMIRNRPDIVATWNDETVIRRWVQVSYLTKSRDGVVREPSDEQLAKERIRCNTDSGRIDELRVRLADPSAFMKCVNENISRRVNRARGTKGHVWEDRFYSKPLEKEAAILLCALYIELNQVRAGEASTPETSRFTTAYTRIRQFVIGASRAISEMTAKLSFGAIDMQDDASGFERHNWLGPLPLDESDRVGEEEAEEGLMHRASNKGWLPMTLAEYLSLLDWTGRQIRDHRTGSIPQRFRPLLIRLGVSQEDFDRMILGFSRMFKTLLRTPREAAMVEH